MRILDQAHLDYESQFYEVDDDALDGISVANKIKSELTVLNMIKETKRLALSSKTE